MKLILIGLGLMMMVLSGCSYFHPRCPPTEICPQPPPPREVLKPILDSPKLTSKDSASTVIKFIEDDLGKCLRYSDELDMVLDGYRKK